MKTLRAGSRSVLTMEVSALPAEVFEYLANLTRHREWYQDKEWEQWLTSPLPVQRGTTFQARRTKGVGVTEFAGVVTVFDPPTRLEYRLHGPSGTDEWRFMLQPRGVGTQLTCESNVLASGWRLVLAPWNRWRARGRALRALENIRSKFSASARPVQKRAA